MDLTCQSFSYIMHYDIEKKSQLSEKQKDTYASVISDNGKFSPPPIEHVLQRINDNAKLETITDTVFVFCLFRIRYTSFIFTQMSHLYSRNANRAWILSPVCGRHLNNYAEC